MVRCLAIAQEEPFGAIDTIKDAYWNVDPTQPLPFIYEWYGTRYSDVIEKGVGAKLSTVTRDGREYTEVTVPPKEGNGQTVVLLFDQDNRMVERKEIDNLYVYSREEFSGYQRHEGPGKDAIWFPHKAVYHYYAHMGDRRNIEEYRTETIDIRSIEFNVDIPDETFALQFPPGTKIHDSTRRSVYSLVVGPGQWLKGKPLPALEDFGVKPAGGLAGGKRIAVCFCDLQQRPSRHAVETLAAGAELWRQEGLVVVLVIPGGEAGTASANWLKDRKVTFAVGRLPADEGQARRILSGWGATALPHIVLTDASHTVTAEAVAADALEAVLKDSAGAIQPAPPATSRPAPAGPTTQPAPAGQAAHPARLFRLILLDDSGKPIDGAEVAVSASSKPDSPATGRTDSQGWCTIPLPAADADRWHFEVTKPGYVPLGCWVERTFAESLFVDPKPQRMSKSCTIGGVVKDEAGRPIKNVTMDFGWRDEKDYYQALTDDRRFKQARTDEKGRWSCNFVPAKPSDVTGYIQIFLRHLDYVSDGPPDSSISLNRSRDSLYPRPPLDALRSQKAVHVIKRGTVLTGKVTDSAGKPVAGAEVMLAILPAAVRAAVETTAADGTFTFQHADPACNACIVTAKGYAMEMASVDANSGAPLAIRLSPGRPIDVKIIDSRGVPVPQVQVGLVEWRGQLHVPYLFWWTGIGGRFTWPDAPADGAVFHIGKAGYMPQSGVTLRPSDSQQVITLSGALKITGRVLDAATGKLIEGANVTPGIGLSSRGRIGWERPVNTTRDGAYEVRLGDGFGQYSLRAEARGYMTLIHEVVPGDAVRLNVDFRMNKAEPIAGTVLGLDGKPLAKAKVKLIIPSAFFDRDTFEMKTAADGGFSFTAIPDEYVLTVETKDGFAQVSRAELAGSREIRLAPWGRIEGVVMQGTRPVAKAEIYGIAVQDHPPQQAYRHIYATADDQGRFEIQRVPPGRYWLGKTVQGGRVAATSQTITVRAGQTTTATLGSNGRLVVAKLKLPAVRGASPFIIARAKSAAFMELRQHMKGILPERWDTAQLSEQAVWRNRWLASDEGKKDRELAERVSATDRYPDELLNSDGRLEAYDLPPGKYVLCVHMVAGINRKLVKLASLEYPFEVPPIGPDDLDTPLNLGTLEVMPLPGAPKDIIAPPAQAEGGTMSSAPGHASRAADPGQTILKQPLKLDLAAALAGKKLLVVVASIEQRPSRRMLDTLAAQADAVAKQGFAIVLVHPAVTDEAQVKQWLKDHKLDVAQIILAKDQADAAKLMVAFGAESLPFMLTADDKHVVTVLDIQADKLDQLRGLEQPPAAKPQSTTSPASTQPAADAAEIERLIKQLGSDKFAEREAAQQALVKIGEPAKAALQAAARDKKQERASRAVSALKQIEESLLVGTTGWGQPNDGLRCRWVFSHRPVPVDTQPELMVEVQNVSKELIEWQCRSEMTLGVTFGGNSKQGGAMPQFLIESAGGVSATGSGLAIPAGGTVRLKARWPYVVHKPGRYHVEAILVRQPIPVNESTALWPKTFTCPPMVVSVADAAGRVPDTDPMEGAAGPWGPAVDGMQVRINGDLSFHNPGAAAAHLSVDMRNFGKSSMSLLLRSEPWSAPRGMLATEAIEVEVDGVWYHGSKTWGGTETTPLGPGNRYRDMEVMPANDWLDKVGKRLNLGTVKRTVRVAVTVQPADGKGKPVRLVSNAVVLRSAAELPEYRTATTAPTTTSAPHAAGPASIQPDKLGQLGDILAATQQPTTKPAPPAAAGGDK
jgi:hypothetical protein